MNGTRTTSSRLDIADFSPRLPLVGLLLIQIFLGYEWLISGVTKVYRGDFTTHMSDELTEKSEGAVSWYKSFLDSVVIPNARGWAYAIELGEVLIGIALIAAALVWLFRWDRLPDRSRMAVLLATALASLGGIFMNLNFHLANGSPHPWLIPGDAFDEGVDLDSLMPALQLVLIAVSVGALYALRRTAPRSAAIAKAKPQGV